MGTTPSSPGVSGPGAEEDLFPSTWPTGAVDPSLAHLTESSPYHCTHWPLAALDSLPGPHPATNPPREALPFSSVAIASSSQTCQFSGSFPQAPPHLSYEWM